MGEDEVLAARLADDARVVAVIRDVGPDRLPHRLEHRGRPSEMHAGELRARQRGVAVPAGFQSAVLPMSAGAVGRLPPIAVKLNGVTAKTKPSSGRYSIRFQAPGPEKGCSS